MKPNPFFYTILLLASLALSACSTLSAGPLQTESRVVELEGAESAQVEIQMSAGRLRIESGSQALLEGAFTYNIPEWRPETAYSVDGEIGQLVIQQPAGIEILPQRGVSLYDWNLRLNDQIPISLSVNLGAGEAFLFLGSLRLNDLNITTGVGNTTIDLSGNLQNDLNIEINGGAGQIDLHLPSRVGIRIETSGIAVVNTDELVKEGNIYTNQIYEQTEHTLFINFQAGLGALNIDME